MSRRPTRRQHHVWRYFLNAWAGSDGRIFCRSGSRIFPLNPRHAAVETDFYKLNKLSEGDLAFVTRMVELAAPAARPALMNFVRMLDPDRRLEEWVALMGNQADAEAMMKRDLFEAEEIYHSGVERDAQSILEALRTGAATSIRDGTEMRHFCYFLGVQLFRTKAIKARTLARTARLQPSPYLSANSWNIQSHIYAANLGYSIYSARTLNPINILTNCTQRHFITGDQPIINLHGRGDGLPPEHMALYYPISPRKAVFIDDAAKPLGLHGADLKDDDVKSLNDRIAASSFKQIFGLTGECLAALRGGSS